jgi:hypothetical protein
MRRELAVRQIAKWVGRHEVGYNNRGPFVEMLQRADSLPGEGYAWCQSLQNGAWRLVTGGRVQKVNGRDEIVGGTMLGGGTASVGMFRDWARSMGYIVTRPFRGDHVLFQFTSDTWPDHIGIVEKVLRLGPVLILQTLEGNTSPDAGGSQSDGGGVYRRRRVVRTSKVIFVRMPGDVEVESPPPPKPKPEMVTAYRVQISPDNGPKVEFITREPAKELAKRNILKHNDKKVLITRTTVVKKP